MELKAGYKKTEVGSIPIDWEVKQLSSFSSVVRGGSPRPAGDPKYFNGSYIPWLTVASITNISDSEMFVSETAGSLTEAGSKHSRILEKNTVIISNSGATLGVTKILNIKCCANDGIAALINLVNCDKVFISHYLNTLTKYLRDIVATGNGQPNLNTGLIGNLFIPFPKLKEQAAIANALSDADALIQALQKLIAKKHQIKQGTMQTLLNPFENDVLKTGWSVKKFDAIANFYSGGTPLTSNASYYNGDISWITSGDLNSRFVTEVNGKITKIGLENSSAKMIKEGTVLIALYGATAGVSAIALIPAAINQAVLAIEPYEDNSYFIFFMLEYLKDSIIKTYTQGGQPNLSGDIVKSIELALPSHKEQTHIATILSDMDADIAALETKLTKYQKIKQGMMQNLLTGRIRLV